MRDIKSLRLKYRVKSSSDERNTITRFIREILENGDESSLLIFEDWVKEQVDETTNTGWNPGGYGVMSDVEYMFDCLRWDLGKIRSGESRGKGWVESYTDYFIELFARLRTHE